jgi:RNA polymerase-binding transcription factor DksA
MSKKKKSATKKTVVTKKAVAKKKPVAPKKSATQKKQPAEKVTVAPKGRPPIKKKVTSKKNIIQTPIKAVKAVKGVKAGKAINLPITPSKKKKEKPEVEKKVDNATKEAVLKARTRKNTPSIFKIKAKNTPIVFTLDDVQEIIKKKKENAEVDPANSAGDKQESRKTTATNAKNLKTLPKAKVSKHGAASLTDILGFNPNKKEPQKHTIIDEDAIPKKWAQNYESLIAIRNNIISGLDLHTKETLHRSSKDASGDLSNYSQHMADAGTENFDRDFVLSLVSSEQEALLEVEEAIKRIANGTYGICEITGVPIKKERLLAVPFTRHSLEGQRQLESTRKHTIQERSNPFADLRGDDAIKISDTEES